MKKPIFLALLTLTALLLLLPTTVMAGGGGDSNFIAVDSISDWEEAFADGQGKLIIINFSGAFDWSAADGEPYTLDLTPVNCGDIYIYGTWTIPSNVTIVSPQKVRIYLSGNLIINGTWDCGGDITFSGMSNTVTINGTVQNTTSTRSYTFLSNTININGAIIDYVDIHGFDVNIYKAAQFTKKATVTATYTLNVGAGTPYIHAMLKANNRYMNGTGPVVFTGDIYAKSLSVTGACTIAAGSTLSVDSLIVGSSYDAPPEDYYLNILGTMIVNETDNRDIHQEVKLANSGILYLYGRSSFGENTSLGKITGTGKIFMYAKLESLPGNGKPYYFGRYPTLFGESEVHPAQVADTITIYRNWLEDCIHPTWTEPKKMSATDNDPPHAIQFCTECGSYYKKQFITIGETDVFIDRYTLEIPDEMKDTLAQTVGDVHVDLSLAKNVNKVVLPDTVMDAVGASETATSLTVTTRNVSASFSKTVIESVSEKMTDNTDLYINLNTAGEYYLSDSQKETVNSMNLSKMVCLSLEMEIEDAQYDTDTIHDLGGTATIRTKFTVNPGFAPRVAYLADDGTLTPIKSQYQDDIVTFETDHFSIFLVYAYPEETLVELQYNYADEILSVSAYLNDTSSGTVIVARYDNGKMTASQAFPLTSTDCQKGLWKQPVKLDGTGRQYKAYLLDTETFAPLCKNAFYQ